MNLWVFHSITVSMNIKNAMLCSKTFKSLNRLIPLTQCCTQFKSPGDEILCVLYLHYNVAFTFK